MNAELPLPFPSSDQKEIYKRIRNYLAGRVVGATRDKALLEELIKTLFCRVYMTYHSGLSGRLSRDPIEVSEGYRSVFREVRLRLPSVFDTDDELSLDPESLSFVDEQLSLIDLVNPVRDPLGDAYEAFASSSLRQQEGQFFTPQNAVDWIVHALAPQEGERIVDPACGAGGFLSSAARYLARKGISTLEIHDALHGIEKDALLARLARSHIAVTTLSEADIKCADALSLIDLENNRIDDGLLGTFDIVMSNPPFGSKIVSASDSIRSKFELGNKWRKKRGEERYERTNVLQANVPPQVLFVERIISLLRPGGRFGLVLPESMLSSSSYGYVVQYMRESCILDAVVGMPEALFKSSGKGGTHTKTCLVVGHKKSSATEEPRSVFMAEAKWCGHDSRGRHIPKDDLPQILDDFEGHKAGEQDSKFSIGYRVAPKSLSGTVLCPRYYNPEAENELRVLRGTHDLLRVGDLIDEGILELSTGCEPGKLAYGTGDIPFVRTSDISNWEIKFDPKHCVSEEIYQQYAKKQDVREGDLFFVRDGTYLIGSCAFVSEYDTKILYQSHIYKIRSKDWKRISPFLLLASFSCEPVMRQIRAKRFTQDIIDTIGGRIAELVLPIPRDAGQRSRIEDTVKQVIKDRVEARELARKARLEVCAPPSDV